MMNGMFSFMWVQSRAPLTMLLPVNVDDVVNKKPHAGGGIIEDEFG
jgi:hypothetical protein